MTVGVRPGVGWQQRPARLSPDRRPRRCQAVGLRRGQLSGHGQRPPSLGVFAKVTHTHNARTRMHACTHASTRTDICMVVHMHTCSHTHAHTHKQMHTHTQSQICMHTLTKAHTHTHAPTRTHSQTHTRAPTHTHMHTILSCTQTHTRMHTCT